MSIQTISTKETQLSHMLTVCSEALKAVTAERDALHDAVEVAKTLVKLLKRERDTATNAALERAAVVCDETDTEYQYYNGDQHDDAGHTLQQAARAIRALKEKS